MPNANAKCPNCGGIVLIDSKKEANICPDCGDAFVTEKAITLYNKNYNSVGESKPKKRHVWKSLGRGLLMTLECLGYLLYVITFMWLIFDIADDLKKK